jgi:hypothetical protein
MKKTIALVLILALYMVTEVANADFTFGEPVNLGPPFNTLSSGGGFSISTDGLEAYISSDRSGGLGYVDMWRSTRENTDNPWGPLVNVQEINSPYNEAFPCLSGDGLTLYFSDWYYWNDAGDRPGGVGQHDLWMCTRPSTGDPWGPPVNMGAIVNSPNPEVLPSVSRDGRILIFASKNRSGGLGDYDLWMSTRPAAEGDWATPVNMGPAVNSSAYDGDGCLSMDGLALFFSSSRPGGRGSFDIWMTTRPSQAAAWNPPVNLGPAINTSAGEGVPSLSPDQKTLYFGSGIRGLGLMYEVAIMPIVDFNGDGIVDSADMCMMIDHWGEDYSLCDIGPMPWGDGVVDVEDLKVLAEYLFGDMRSVAHFMLDESKGSIANDSAMNRDGTVHGDPEWHPAGGVVGGALQLDGIDDYVKTGFVLNPAKGALSVFIWVRGGAPGQVVLSQIGGANWLLADPDEGTLMTELISPGRLRKPLQSQTNITDGIWHRIGLVWDGSNRTLYVDDIEVAKDTQNGLEGSDSGLYIGCGKAMEAETFFSGLIDDVRIYNRSVTP